MAVKYIFITGGVVSGLGKGITAASLGRLLKARGLRVTMQKLDPYININPSMMSPIQHGEVFVTDDGAECDLDIGHYERFIDENLSINANTTAGKIYWSVINKERSGEYGGATVQVIPHITNEIKQRIYRIGKTGETDIVITEIGGTVGDIESLPFLEATRQVAIEVGRENCMYIHVALLPYMTTAGEIKTKPVQHSVKALLGLGIQPDVIVCRSEVDLNEEIRSKISLFCNVPVNAVIQNMDVQTIYEVPLTFEKEGLSQRVCDRLGIKADKLDLEEWNELVETFKNPTAKVNIALVGKDTELHDAYLSVAEALIHAGMAHKTEVCINWIDSHDITQENVREYLQGMDGIISPGGFGADGAHGQLLVAKYARENDVAFLGIGLGMEMAVLDFAKNVCGIEDADTAEFDLTTQSQVIHIPPENSDPEQPRVDMRKGLFPCKLVEGSKAHEIYNQNLIYERHWHRYEINHAYLDVLSKNKMLISGSSPDGHFAEVIEIPDCKWFMGVLFHPQFKSRPNRPHPLFKDFIRASLNKM